MSPSITLHFILYFIFTLCVCVCVCMICVRGGVSKHIHVYAENRLDVGSSLSLWILETDLVRRACTANTFNHSAILPALHLIL